MLLDKLYSLLCRVFFFGAFLLVCAVAVEKAVNFFGYTILRGYSGGRVLEVAGVLLVFVIAVLLREIREALLAKRA